jgi:hypothetical protein
MRKDQNTINPVAFLRLSPEQAHGVLRLRKNVSHLKSIEPCGATSPHRSKLRGILQANKPQFQKVSFFMTSSILIVISALFIFIPSTHWLHPLPWIKTTFGISVFILPGTILSFLTIKERLSIIFHCITGFMFSVFLVSALGMLGRIFHYSFITLKFNFYITSILLFIALIIYLIRFPDRKLFLKEKIELRIIMAILVLIIFAIIVNFLSRTTGDDQSYLAYLTSWRDSATLSFSEVYFGLGFRDSKRFWLSVFPMNLALIAEISGLHGLLLIGLYIEPFMAGFAILAAYLLYKEFLKSNTLAISAVFLQMTFLFFLRDYQQPGQSFFNRLSEDKAVAAFILAPIFFLAARYLTQKFSLRTIVLFVLSGWSLTLTHPIILAYSIFIGTGYALLTAIVQKKSLKNLLAIVFLAILIVTPGASLRFVDDGTSRISYELDDALEVGAGIETRISFIPNTPFYGFNPDRVKISTLNILEDKNIIQASFIWSYVGILSLVFVWALFRIRKEDTAPLLLTSSLLVLLALIPYTGWLIGYFVSARMLWRIPWVFPIGLAAFVLLKEIFNFLHKKFATYLPDSKTVRDKLFLLTAFAIFLISTLYFSYTAYGEQWSNLSRQQEYKMNLERLVSLGEYLDNKLDKPARFISPDNLSYPIYGLFSQTMMDYLPGLSPKAKVAHFRFFPSPLPIDRIETNLLFITDESINFQQKREIMKKYEIEYIFIDDPDVKYHFASRPDLFYIEEVAGFWLIGLR